MRPIFLLLASAPFVFSQSKTNLSLTELSGSLETLVERVRPAVVQIFSTGYAAPDDSESTNTSSLLARQRSTGSGVILSEDGLILTNNHVVRNALKIEVKLHNTHRGGHMPDSTIPAKLIGVDRE